VELENKYEGEILYEKDGHIDKTWKVWCIQYGTNRTSGVLQKYYEATVVEVVRGVDGAWAIPKSSYVEGTGELIDSKLDGFIAMDITDPHNPKTSTELDEMILAHEQRELAHKKASEKGAEAGSGAGGRAKRQKQRKK
jgi:hypothetical protein